MTLHNIEEEYPMTPWRIQLIILRLRTLCWHSLREGQSVFVSYSLYDVRNG